MANHCSAPPHLLQHLKVPLDSIGPRNEGDSGDQPKFNATKTGKYQISINIWFPTYKVTTTYPSMNILDPFTALLNGFRKTLEANKKLFSHLFALSIENKYVSCNNIVKRESIEIPTGYGVSTIVANLYLSLKYMHTFSRYIIKDSCSTTYVSITNMLSQEPKLLPSNLPPNSTTHAIFT